MPSVSLIHLGGRALCCRPQLWGPLGLFFGLRDSHGHHPCCRLAPCSSSAGGLYSSGLWGGWPCPTPPYLTRLSFSRSCLPQGEKKVQCNTATLTVFSEGRALYQVHYEGSEGQGSAFYDMVVVTTPLHPSRSNFTFENFEPPIANFPSAFQPSVTSVVHGYLNSSYFGFPDPKLFPFASILTTDTPDLFFNAMDNICPVNISVAFRRKQPQEAAVWRVLSQQPLDKQQLKTLFRSYYSVQVTEWQSYPRYDSTKSLPPIVLHDSLFYLSGVEWVASSMEMIAVAAKNVALLAYNRWYQDLEKIDQKDLMHKVKTEL